ncbi:hypothetical protein BIW11_14344 [Tropilaelaps mercedesae]|uniref:Uncharacterized protein n=1 Tax=Tropilaelaps mercedesae TaxID=418985 RepID=A0A1V9WY20_9ACAR|nr:hypothetical protein BIW11_14344 [Tropilaelaps mercedesae]
MTGNDPYSRYNTNHHSMYNLTYDQYNSYSNNRNYSYPSSYNNSYSDSYNSRSNYPNGPSYPDMRNDTYSPPRYGGGGGGGVRGGYGGPGSSQQDNNKINNLNNNMMMNHDGTPFPPGPHRITTTSTTDSPHRSPIADSYCLYKAQDQIRECDSNHQRRQYNARRYHADERIKESCCATLDYKSCLRNSLTNHCGEYGYSTIDSIIAQKVRDADNDCRQFDVYRCTSGASRVGVATMVVMLLGLVVAIVRTL